MPLFDVGGQVQHSLKSGLAWRRPLLPPGNPIPIKAMSPLSSSTCPILGQSF